MTYSSGADQNENESVGQQEEQQISLDTIGSQDQTISAPISSDLVVPPEEQLTAPSAALGTLDNFAEQATQLPVSSWLVVARNRRVNRDWEALLLRAPANARRCYQDLSTAPMVRKPKRVFPLKGKRYSGAWEYEVTSSDRVFYVPDEEKRKVLVYYAGTHPKTAPTPP